MTKPHYKERDMKPLHTRSAIRPATRRTLAARRVPVYDTPGQAVLAFMHLVRYRDSQRALMETPPSVPDRFAPDGAAARAVIERALRDGKEWLTEPEAKAVLAAYRIPVAETRIVADAAAGADERRAGQYYRGLAGPSIGRSAHVLA